MVECFVICLKLNNSYKKNICLRYTLYPLTLKLKKKPKKVFAIHFKVVLEGRFFTPADF